MVYSKKLAYALAVMTLFTSGVTTLLLLGHIGVTQLPELGALTGGDLTLSIDGVVVILALMMQIQAQNRPRALLAMCVPAILIRLTSAGLSNLFATRGVLVAGGTWLLVESSILILFSLPQELVTAWRDQEEETKETVEWHVVAIKSVVYDLVFFLDNLVLNVSIARGSWEIALLALLVSSFVVFGSLLLVFLIREKRACIRAKKTASRWRRVTKALLLNLMLLAVLGVTAVRLLRDLHVKVLTLVIVFALLLFLRTLLVWTARQVQPWLRRWKCFRHF